MRSLLVSLLLAVAAVAAVPSATAIASPVECGSSIGVCVWDHAPAGTCVGVHVGLQGGSVCANEETGNVRACSSLRTALYDGNCPTDLVTLG